MKFARTTSTLLLLAAFGVIGASAHAQSLTREQVKAELMEAIRTGDISAGGNSGAYKLNELFPNEYPRSGTAKAMGAGQAAPAAAAPVRSSGAVPSGELGVPGQEYAQRTGGKTREQVKAETLEAIRNGEIASGEMGQSPSQQNPQAYAKSRTVRMAQPADGGAMVR